MPKLVNSKQNNEKIRLNAVLITAASQIPPRKTEKTDFLEPSIQKSNKIKDKENKLLKKHHWIIIIGIIILVIGIVATIFLFISGLKDPSEEAVWEGNFAVGETGDGKKAYLDAGDYDVWYKNVLSYDPGEVTIKDRKGNVVFRDSIGSSKETISINGETYTKVGSFKIDKKDTYNVNPEYASTLYITPPIDMLGMIKSVCGGGIMIIIGIIFIIAGVIKWMRYEDRPRKYQQYQVPPPYPQYTPPYQYQQPLYNKQYCPRCRSETQYSGNENDYYCWTCKQYIGEMK